MLLNVVTRLPTLIEKLERKVNDIIGTQERQEPAALGQLADTTPTADRALPYEGQTKSSCVFALTSIIRGEN